MSEHQNNEPFIVSKRREGDVWIVCVVEGGRETIKKFNNEFAADSYFLLCQNSPKATRPEKAGA